MTFNDVYERFVKESPVCVMMRSAFENVFSAEKMEAIFEDNAQLQYSSELLFSTVADMMASVVCRIHPSINAAYRSRAETLGVSVNAVYDKLQGIEPQVSRALMQSTAADMAAMIKGTGAVLPEPVPGYHVKIVDGNHLRRTDRRIGETRLLNDAPLPGKSLVVLDPQLRLAIDMIPCEDGHANERRLFPELSECVQRRDLWIGDRNFCTTGFLFPFFKKGAYFVVRQHGTSLHWELQGRRRRVGEMETGIVYEQAMRVFDEEGNFRVIRRISVVLHEPTRDGDMEIHILTNLPAKIGSLKVAEIYRNRWTIETAFQEMAENLEGEIKTLGYLKAALFGFCIALVIYNILNVIRAAIDAAVSSESADQSRVSIYYLADEIAGTSRGMTIALPAPFWTKKFGELKPHQMGLELVELARHVQVKKYRPNTWKPKKPKKKKGKQSRRGHVSTGKLIDHRKPMLA